MGGRLVGVQSVASQSVGVDTDVEPAVPVTVGTDTAGEAPTDLIVIEGHPVDAAITQSSANGRHGREAARQVLVGGDSEPVGARRGHVSIMPGTDAVLRAEATLRQ